MKKSVFSIFMALALVFSMAVPAFAAARSVTWGTGGNRVTYSWDDAVKEVELGGNVSFSVTADRNNNNYYQWRKDGTSISGNWARTATTYSINNVSFSDAGKYALYISGNSNGGGQTANTNSYPMELKVYAAVRFIDGDDEILDPQWVYNGLVEKPGTPEKDGYTFTGWMLNGDLFDFDAPITSSITLEATWEEDIKNYTVTFDYKGGEGSLEDIVVTPGEAYGELPVPTRDGYVFRGWSLDGTIKAKSAVTANTIVSIAEDHTLYALWAVDTSKTYKIAYDSNGAGGTAPVDTMSYVTGSMGSVSGQGGLARNGYAFAGWNTKADGSGTSYTAGAYISVNSDITLYAQWERVPVVFHKLAYDANGAISGAAPVDSTDYGAGSVAIVSGGGELAKTGYTFAGWNTQAKGSGDSYAPGDYIFINGDTTLYAQWTQDIYRVTYNANGAAGTAPVDTMDYFSGGAMGEVLGQGDLSRTGLTFTGWNTQANGKGDAYQPGSWITVNGNITLYAQWKNTVLKVAYDGNGATSGSAPVDTMDYYGMIAVQAADHGSLARTGFTFGGWNTAADGKGTAYQPGDMVMSNENITLYAQWKNTVLRITYDSNGATSGSAPVDTMDYYGMIAVQAADQGDLERTGLTFGGWNTAANGKGIAYQPGDMVMSNENITLYAQWTQNIYRVTYNGNGAASGSTPVDTMDYYGMVAAQAAEQGALERDGFIFDGWNTEANGEGTAYQPGDMIFANDNVTLYAQWIMSMEEFDGNNAGDDADSEVPDDNNSGNNGNGNNNDKTNGGNNGNGNNNDKTNGGNNGNGNNNDKTNGGNNGNGNNNDKTNGGNNGNGNGQK